MLFLEKLEQKKLYITLVIAICMLIGMIYAIVFMPERFVSQTSVMLMKVEESGNDEIKNNGNIELTNNQMATFEELIKSDSNIQEAVKKLNLTTEINKGNVSVKRVSDSDTFQINVSSSNSDEAVKINSEITKIFGNTISVMYQDAKVYIVDEAHIISSSKIHSIITFTIGSLIIGILISLVYIIALIIIEKNIKNERDVESNFSLKVLGLIPLRKLNKNVELISSEVEKTSTNKAFKKLRSNIQFLNVNNNNKNIILITNCTSQEGKSYIAANLAISYANVGKKVILIDSSLNEGKQSEIFNIPNNMGLSNFLSNLDETGVEINERVNSFINETNIKNLNIITSGTVPPNSSELLSSEKFAQMLKDLSVFYDVIILDGTSILNKIDSLILSRHATSSLIVTIPKKTKKDDLWKTKRDIQNVGGRIIGVVLNKVKVKEEKEEKISYKIIESLKEKIKEYILKLKDNKKQKLLSESTVIDESNTVYVEEKNEDIILTNAIIDEEKEDTNKIEEIKIEENKEKVEDLQDENVEEKSIVEDNTEIINSEEIVETKEPAEISNEISNNEKINSYKKILLDSFIKTKKFVRKNFKKIKIKSIKLFRKAKETIKSKTEESKEPIENESNSENIKVIENNVKQDNIETSPKKKVQSENAVLVIVDSDNEVCRAFSKKCFTEKLVRGLDTSDGFVKAHYSSYLVRKRTEALILMYTLTKKQASRIDPLVYSTLSDYDEHVWIEQKTTSNKAESYVIAMTREYEKNNGEKRKDYLERCRKLRIKELENAEIEIDYKVDLLWKTSKMKFSDKVAMDKYAKIYGKTPIEPEAYDIEYSEEENEDEYLQEKNETEVKKKKISLKKINPLKKIEEVTNIIANTEQVRAKSIKEIEEEVDNKLNRKNNYSQENTFNVNSKFSEVIVEEENEEYNLELQKQERKKEAEVLKKIQKEKVAKKRKEERTRKQKQKEEKNKQREEQRKAKEIEREKKIEEARIEEELLGDNLYPKTKYNKNL